MSEGFGPTFRHLLDALAVQPGASLTEDAEICRVDGARCHEAGLLRRLAEAARTAAEDGYGTLEVYGAISDAFDPGSTPFEDVEGETLQVILRKAASPGWRYFVTRRGFAASLSDEIASEPLAVWVCEPFEAFSALTMSVSPWGGTREPPVVETLPERPRKLVRDLTHGRTPPLVGPWLLTSRPRAGSPVFDAWAAVAVEKLAYALPYEVRTVEGQERVVLKGPRNASVAIVPTSSDWPGLILDLLTEAATWVYASPREAEARFLFLNNHLSLDWRDGLYWPDGLLHLLPSSLPNARDAYAFHLGDQSKDALKTLGDLRKSLQDEVARAQATTRDLISSLWRDLAVAGVVLALKSPTAPQIASAEVLRWVTLATALLLLVSLGVTVFANARFNKLADEARGEWRRKLYAFVSEKDWGNLVDRPIRQGRWVYHLALPVVVLLYAAAASYLVAVAEPGWLAAIKDALAKLFLPAP